MKEILYNFAEGFSLLFNKVILFFSVLGGVLLSAIGYPKEVLMFILTMVVIDLLTKQYAIVKVSYGSFTLRNYCKAWKDKKLTSRELKNGIGVKTFLYMPVLYMAHKASVVPEILYGNVISNVMYTLLIIVEFTSMIENFILAGHTLFVPFLKFIKSKQQQILDIEYDKK